MSKDAKSWSYREGLKQFIAAYRGLPCLWQVRHRHYYNREKRYEAVDELLEKLRLVEPRATRDDVMRKINSLRSVYKKEHRKVLEARRTGEERAVSLWCYPLMRFIDQRLTKEGELEDDGEAEDVDDEPSEEVVFIKEEAEEDGDETNEYNSIEVLEEMEDEEEVLIPEKRPKLEYGHSDASNLTESRIEDCHDVYCRSVACKLRGMPRDQRLLAERLVNEVLFEAECGLLTRHHRLQRPSPASSMLMAHLMRDQGDPPDSPKTNK